MLYDWSVSKESSNKEAVIYFHQKILSSIRRKCIVLLRDAYGLNNK